MIYITTIIITFIILFMIFLIFFGGRKLQCLTAYIFGDKPSIHGMAFLLGLLWLYFPFVLYIPEFIYAILKNRQADLDYLSICLGVSLFSFILCGITFAISKIPETREKERYKEILREELNNIPYGSDFFTISFNNYDFVFEPELEDSVDLNGVCRDTYIYWLDWSVRDLSTKEQRYAYFRLVFENDKFVAKDDSDLYRTDFDFFVHKEPEYYVFFVLLLVAMLCHFFGNL